eukprot:gene4044-5786_t
MENENNNEPTLKLCKTNLISSTEAALPSIPTIPMLQSDSKSSSKNEHVKTKRILSATQLINCGLVSGAVQSIIFNPWDRALYLSVKENRKFLDLRNFEKPFAGVFQTIAQRTLSAGLFFPLEELYINGLTSYFTDEQRPWLRPCITMLAGILAGAANGIVMNPMSSVKYHYWGDKECGKENFFRTAKDMFIKGGIRPFFIGSLATVQRDLVFGGTFSTFRHEMLISDTYLTSEQNKQYSKKSMEMLVNLIAASVATVLSSPFNYIRNMNYATPPGIKPLDSRTILQELYQNAMMEQNFVSKFRYMQSRLRIGWGTARVGCGMAVGAQIYTTCANYLRDM